jgi:hypothetical protein
MATMEWKLIDTAPFDRDVELAVTDSEGKHALAFPCRRDTAGWIDAETNKRLYFYYIRPRHWRDWSLSKRRSAFSGVSRTSRSGPQA